MHAAARTRAGRGEEPIILFVPSPLPTPYPNPIPEPYSEPFSAPECESLTLVTLGDGFEGEALMAYDCLPHQL